jgi:hypothetical protein
MNGIALAFLLINAIALLTLPRRWAPLPFLVGASYMTIGQGIEIGPFAFTVIRILIAVGVLRIVLRRERITGGINRLDWLSIIWAAVAVFSSLFHNNPADALVFRLGTVYNVCGIYFLIRVFCRSIDDMIGLFRIAAIVFIPVAIEMLSEKMTGINLFAIFGGVPEFSSVREGSIRAQGPFGHAILAGTVGAVNLPLMIALLRQYRKTAMIGIAACITIILASASSGPIASSAAGIGALYMWRYRHNMKTVRWVAIIGYLALDFVMKAPAYYLMARIPIVAGSTGWHRARLIESAFAHIDEWWLAGTDYTRHWMPTGVSWNPDHTDITNHYLQMGVLGGLPLMIIFIGILIVGFSYVGQARRQVALENPGQEFIVWTLGAALFAQTATMISVSFFDQSFLFLYFTLAIIGSVWAITSQEQCNPQSAPASLQNSYSRI